MATGKPRFEVTRNREFISEESAKRGDVDRYEEQFRDVAMTLRETVRELSECCEISSGPIRKPADLCGREWGVTEPRQDQYSGEYESDSIHVRETGRNDCRPRNLYRVLRLSGLIRGNHQ
jgi:hypothetical protein